jgi:hypothetical protein
MFSTKAPGEPRGHRHRERLGEARAEGGLLRGGGPRPRDGTAQASLDAATSPASRAAAAPSHAAALGRCRELELGAEIVACRRVGGGGGVGGAVGEPAELRPARGRRGARPSWGVKEERSDTSFSQGTSSHSSAPASALAAPRKALAAALPYGRLPSRTARARNRGSAVAGALQTHGRAYLRVGLPGGSALARTSRQ